MQFDIKKCAKMNSKSETHTHTQTGSNCCENNSICHTRKKRIRKRDRERDREPADINQSPRKESKSRTEKSVHEKICVFRFPESRRNKILVPHSYEQNKGKR